MSYQGDSGKKYGARAFGTVQPIPRDDEYERRDMSANREELLEDMLDLILKHKKELKKIPACSHISTAQNWAAARKLVAKEVDLDGDGTPETVVYDRSGKHPYVVNGYKLAPSDYHIRHEYYKTHPTESKRIEQPMREWIQDEVYETKKDPNNQWVVRSVTNKALGNKLAAWNGYSMPSKPKKRASPYSIFSKLIAPKIKEVWIEQWFIDKLKIKYTQGTGAYWPAIINKIISPITMYRWLYLRMIEQKHYFFLKHNGVVANYGAYKKRVKTEAGKAQFYKWFDEWCLSRDKSNLDVQNFSRIIIQQNLINGELNLDGSDPKDGFVQLIGPDNLNDGMVAYKSAKDNTEISLIEVLQDNDLAKEMYDILNDRTHPYHHFARICVSELKEVAQVHVKANVLSANGILTMMEDPIAFEQYASSMTSTGGNSMNITSQEGFDEHVRQGGKTNESKPKSKETEKEAEKLGGSGSGEGEAEAKE